MRHWTMTFLAALLLAGGPAVPRLSAQGSGPEIISFDAPGAGSTAGSGFGTFATGINDGGTITGHFVDAFNVSHGFVRRGDELVRFDAPGAGNTKGSGQGTFATSINKAGAITGRFTDPNNVNHGFLRDPSDAHVTTFDAPAAGKAAGSGQGTFPESISDAGAVTGHYIDANNVVHGFVRSPTGGRSTAFAVPGAGATAGSGQGTFPESLDDQGAIAGHYIDSNNVKHGFLRTP